VTPPRLLSQLVEAAADRDGDADAVRSFDGRRTYGELLRDTARLASTLTDLGVQRGDRVGVYVHKSVASFTAVHAILRVGAAYVPIDPAAPASVVAEIVADCGIEVLVSEPRQQREVAQLGGCGLRAVVGTDGDVGGLRFVTADEVAGSDERPAVKVLDDDIAYVMYTSGSTGRPKGIVHTHRSGMHYAEHAAAVYGLRPDDRLANSAPLHFDISTFEVFAGPLAGASTLVIPEPHLRMPASLSQLIADDRCTTWYSVPFLLTELVTRGALDQRDLGALRWIIFGGEVMDPAVLAALAPHVPHARFSNSYGPAEVNQCTYHHFDLPPAPGDIIPIGDAWPGADVRIVDDELVEVPGATVGELLVSSPTMMEGYWGRDDLTTAAIRHEPLPGGRTRRWLRTGDLVQRRADGLIEFVGRRDHQVKVRGNRVELESVEAVLASLDGVDVAIAGIVEVDRTTALGAVVRLNPGAHIDPVVALKEASARLPSYAVPFTLAVIDDVPLTPSGKVDRRAVRERLGGLISSAPSSQGTSP
jgi:amino acid adenylation domain-containing protein